MSNCPYCGAGPSQIKGEAWTCGTLEDDNGMIKVHTRFDVCRIRELGTELGERREQVGKYQQIFDECIVALHGSSLGVNYKDLPGRIRKLETDIIKLRGVASEVADWGLHFTDRTGIIPRAIKALG